MTIDQGIALAFKWLKLVGCLALLLFIILTLAKLFGFSIYGVPSMDWQSFGVFAAGTAYALKSL